MTKFSTKQPFRHHVAPSQRERHDGEGSQGGSAGGEGTKEAKTAMKKKPAIACLFCRERKICCGPPAADDTDQRCK
jgi:hypothetical protein